MLPLSAGCRLTLYLYSEFGKLSQEEIISPGRLAWKKLKQHKSAMFGFYVILISFFIAVFCYLLVPDATRDSNSMQLSASFLPPGSTVEFLRLPGAGYQTKPSLTERWFTGETPRFKEIPLSWWKANGDNISIEEYGAASGDSSARQTYTLSQLSSLYGRPVTIREVIITRHYLLGTDRFGRDLLSRLMVATRVSLSVGLIAVVISLFIGITLGAVAGYFRGTTDRIIQWFINVIWSIPTLLLVVAITMALGKGFVQVFIAVGLTMWVEVARLVRGQFFSLRELQFVEAGQALGYKNARIIFRHILPNVIGPVIVMAASNFASAILLEAGLSFLGMGAQPPTPSWGMMIKENYSYIVMDAAWLAIFPGAAIALMVLSFTLLGNGLRDAFDTRL